MAHTSRIVYIEKKPSVTGQARIGRVRTSKTGRTLYYDGKTFQSLKGAGFKANYFDVETGVRPSARERGSRTASAEAGFARLRS